MEVKRRSRHVSSSSATTVAVDDGDEKLVKIAEQHKSQRQQRFVTLFLGTSWFLLFGVLSKNWNLFKRKERIYPRQAEFITEDPLRQMPSMDHRVLIFFPEPNSRMNRKPEIGVIPMITLKKIEELADSESYDDKSADQFETERCKAQYAWQMGSYPTCNSVHEYDMNEIFDDKEEPPLILLDNGYYRDVWQTSKTTYSPHVVMKTMRYEHVWGERNFDRNRRDAMSLERLSASPWVLDVYSFCAGSGFYEFAEQGSVNNKIFPKKSGHHIEVNPMNTPLEFLKYAIQASSGLAAAHNSDREGVPALAHTDITPTQFVITNGRVKLNDFNRARFLRWDIKQNKICPHHVGNNPGKNRAPEEYAYEPQTEKIDVYSLGNIFYMLLSRQWPFPRMDEKQVYSAVKNGHRPPMPELVENSNKPIHRALLVAMEMCHSQDPEKRATARQVQKYLFGKVKEIAPEMIVPWELSQIEREIQ